MMQKQNPIEQNTISITLRMDDKHDVRAVRLLLKLLLRAYGLKCVGLGTVSDEPAGAAIEHLPVTNSETF